MSINADGGHYQPLVSNTEPKVPQEVDKETLSQIQGVVIPPGKVQGTIMGRISRIFTAIGRNRAESTQSKEFRDQLQILNVKLGTTESTVKSLKKSIKNLQNAIDRNTINHPEHALATIATRKQELLQIRKEWHETKMELGKLEEKLENSLFKNASQMKSLRSTESKIDKLFKNVFPDSQLVRTMEKVETESAHLRELTNYGDLRKSLLNADAKISRAKNEIFEGKAEILRDALVSTSKELKLQNSPELVQKFAKQMTQLSLMKKKASSAHNYDTAVKNQETINSAVNTIGARNYINVLMHGIEQICLNPAAKTEDQLSVLSDQLMELSSMEQKGFAQDDIVEFTLNVSQMVAAAFVNSPQHVGFAAIFPESYVQIIKDTFPRSTLVEQEGMLKKMKELMAKNPALYSSETLRSEIKSLLEPYKESILNGSFIKELNTLIHDSTVAVMLKADELTAMINDKTGTPKQIAEKRAELSQSLGELKRQSIVDSDFDLKSLTKLLSGKLIPLFNGEPLHVGFALVFPEIVTKEIESKFSEVIKETRETTNGQDNAYVITSHNLSYLGEFFANVETIFSEREEVKSLNRFTPKLLSASFKEASESQLKSFLTELTNECENISIEAVLAKKMGPKISAGINSGKIGNFTQETMASQETNTSAWDESAAKIVMGEDYKTGRETTLETATGDQVIVTSLKKDIGNPDDEFSGDGARSFNLQNGVSAHVVVDAAGNNRGSFEATAAVIAMVSQRLTERTNDLNVSNPEDIENFMREILGEGMKICGDHERECTFTLNLVFPGADGKRLLVGVSVGDTFVFTRKPDGNGGNEVKTLTTTFNKEQSFSGGALGNNIMSVPRIFDVFCHELAPDEELYIASDAVGDNFDSAVAGLRKGDDVTTSILTPVMQRGMQQKKMQELFNSIVQDFKKLETEGKLGSDEYNSLLNQHKKLNSIKRGGEEAKFDIKDPIHKILLTKLLGKEEVTEEDFNSFNALLQGVKPDDYSLIEVLPKASQKSNDF